MQATFSLALGPFSWAQTDWRPVIQNPTPAAPALPAFFRKSRRLVLVDITGLLIPQPVLEPARSKLLRGLADGLEALLHVVEQLGPVLLVLEGQDAREVHFLQRLEDADHVELALAQRLLVLALRPREVLDVDVVHARTEGLNPLDRILPDAQDVARVDAGADLDRPLLDGLLDLVETAVGFVLGAVVVDRDQDAVFLGQRRQRFE